MPTETLSSRPEFCDANSAHEKLVQVIRPAESSTTTCEVGGLSVALSACSCPLVYTFLVEDIVAAVRRDYKNGTPFVLLGESVSLNVAVAVEAWSSEGNRK